MVSCEIFGLTGNIIGFNVILGHNLMAKLRSLAQKMRFGVARQPHKKNEYVFLGQKINSN